jgi:hypothetical protein
MDLTASGGALKISVELPPSTGRRFVFLSFHRSKPATGGVEQGC